MAELRKLVHFGVGSFHRGHQAYYVQRLNDLSDAKEQWQYTGVNLRKESRALVQKLAAQNGAFWFKTISASGECTYRKIESIRALVDASSDLAGFDSLFADRTVKAITITVTEGGYYLTDSDDLNLVHSEVAADTNPANQPVTLYGFLARALRIRQQATGEPITVLTCDNLRNNGARLEAAFRQFLAAQGDGKLLAWLDANVTFPACMVDRITPVPPADLPADILAETGEMDACPVMGEDFEQWVIEDKFACDFPALERVEVTFTQDVHAFEETKIRILNGGHFLLSYVGALRGYQTYDENIRDEELNGLLLRYHRDEVIPTIENPPVDLEAYRATIIERFSNRYIADSIARIAADSLSKFSGFILPSVERTLKAGRDPANARVLIAHWYCFLALYIEGKFVFNYADPYLPMAKAWFAGKDPVDGFLDSSDLWQGCNQRYPAFREALKNEIDIQMMHYRKQYP